MLIKPTARVCLPADYDELTKAGQVAARRAAVSRTGSPAEDVAGWIAFRRIYLEPFYDEDGSVLYDPGFYGWPFIESPKAHRWLANVYYGENQSIVCAPRGFSKSTQMKSLALRDLVTKPGIRVALFKAKDDFAVDDAQDFKDQLTTNERLLADWGELKPKRGEGQWSGHRVGLQNRSLAYFMSIGGAMRGLRPNVALLDDIEDDKSVMTRSEARLAELRTMLVKTVMPMLRKDCRVMLLGTILSKAAFLNYVFTTDDPRFLGKDKGGKWFKANLPVIHPETGKNIWPEYYTAELLQDRLDMMGPALFETEFMGNPRSESALLFKLDTTKHGYTCDGEHPDSRVSYTVTKSAGGGETKQEPAHRVRNEWLDSMKRGISIDYAPAMSARSDYQAYTIWGLDGSNTLWILDAWHGKLPPNELVSRVWREVVRWRLNLVTNEHVAIQLDLINRFRESAETFLSEHGWAPSLQEVKYPANLSKEDRIAYLQQRFVYGRIKFPFYLQDANPSMKELISQVRNFTLDVQSLAYDDLIDSLAQVQYVNRAAIVRGPQPAMPSTPYELLMAGHTEYPDTGMTIDPALALRDAPLGAILRHLETRRRDAHGDPLGILQDTTILEGDRYHV